MPFGKVAGTTMGALRWRVLLTCLFLSTQGQEYSTGQESAQPGLQDPPQDTYKGPRNEAIKVGPPWFSEGCLPLASATPFFSFPPLVSVCAAHGSVVKTWTWSQTPHHTPALGSGEMEKKDPPPSRSPHSARSQSLPQKLVWRGCAWQKPELQFTEWLPVLAKRPKLFLTLLIAMWHGSRRSYLSWPHLTNLLAL